MRVLLDEQVSRFLALELAGHDVLTVEKMGWKGLENGELLQQAAAAQFGALISMDRRLPIQQDISRYTIGLILVRAKSNRIEDVRPLVPAILLALESVEPSKLLKVGT